MDKEDKFIGVLVIISVAFFLIYGINSYTQAPAEMSQAIAIKDVPVGAEKVGDIKNYIIPYNGVDYGKNVSFLPVSVYDKNFFEIKKFDQIKFSIENKRSGTTVYRDTVVVSIRGITNVELPIVYDYTTELSLWTKDNWELSLWTKDNWYSSDSLIWNTNDQYPWVLNIKNVKSSALSAIFVSGIAGMIVGFIVGLILVLLNRTRQYLWNFAKLKFVKKTMRNKEKKEDDKAVNP